MREVKSFGFTSAGDRVLEVKLKNSEGMKVSLLNYGCIIRSLEVPDKYGKSRDVVLGCDNIIAYEQQDCYLGAVVGRVANRISKAAFTLEGEKYLLTANDGENHLHGGVKGFDKYIWDISEQSESSVLFERMSEDGEEGYPGNLKVSVRYTLLENNSLVINYKAKTDKSTPVNLSNHSYFNLNGFGTVLEHVLGIDSQSFLKTDASGIPFGIESVGNDSDFDFRIPKKIGLHIDSGNVQLKSVGGYDHCFALDGNISKIAAELYAEQSGIKLTCYTNMPGVHVYTANFLNIPKGKNDIAYVRHDAVCLETEFYPDAVNNSGFPSVVLKKEEIYDRTTIFHFSVR